jgi:hypothetical protein
MRIPKKLPFWIKSSNFNTGRREMYLVVTIGKHCSCHFGALLVSNRFRSKTYPYNSIVRLFKEYSYGNFGFSIEAIKLLKAPTRKDIKRAKDILEKIQERLLVEDI